MSGPVFQRLSARLFLAWILGVTAVSLAPLRVKLFLHTVGPLHSAGHVFVFCVSGTFFLLTVKRNRTLLIGFPMLFIFAAVTELLQSAIYHQRFEWSDLVLDSFGLMLSPSIVFAVKALTTRGKSPSLSRL